MTVDADQAGGGRVETAYVEEEIKNSYIDYAMSVIVGRALPDVRDGLKPVHRRILYAMNELSLYHNRPHKKSARIVGEVLGKFHPHGDSAVYDTLVRMAQDFSLRYPLVDGQGNFGSIDGDNPAAMRYTEARLAEIADEMLANIDEETVEFRPNFDESMQEPEVLPARLPNLLVNGSSGIAVGMATNIPPHNLSEVISAVDYQLKNPDCSIEQLMDYLPGPDFPTGGLICSKKGLREMYETGRGKIIMRGVVEVVEREGGQSDRIIITEIPYGVNKAKMIEKIADRVKAEKIEGISDVRDESDRRGIRVVVELKRGANPQVVRNQLFKYTRLEHTFGAQLLALVDGEPIVLNLKQIIDHFIDHRFNVIRRRTRYRLEKARRRAHILEGYLIAIANIDEVVKIIKQSEGPEAAGEKLQATFEITEEQATAILRMQLQRLTSLEAGKVESEHKQLLADIEDYEEILGDDVRVKEIISEELTALDDDYGDDRRTAFSDQPLDVTKEDLIADKPAIFTLSDQGYIKRTDPQKFRLQRRGGRGIYGADPKEGDYISRVFSAYTHDYLLVFTSRGICYWLKGYDIPEGGRRTRGTPIINLIDIQPDEEVMAMIPVAELNKGYLVMATAGGRVKKTDLEAYSRPRKGGIIGIDLTEDDALVSVCRSSGSDDLLLASAAGYAIRFSEDEIRSTGRGTQGVKGIDLEAGDRVVGVAPVQSGKELLTVCENGYGKRTAFDDYRPQTRGGKGLVNLKNKERTGEVVTIRSVAPDDELICISDRGIILRMEADEVSRIGRPTQGVKVMRVMENQSITDVAVAVRERQEAKEDDE